MATPAKSKATNRRQPITVSDKLPRTLKVPAGATKPSGIRAPRGAGKPSGIHAPGGVGAASAVPMPGDALDKPPAAFALPDGRLRFRVQDGPHSGKAIVLDAMLTKLACEPVEAQHGAWRPGWTTTAEFLNDLAKAVEGLGVKGCSPSLAYAIWSAATAEVQTIHRALTEAIGRG